MFQSLKRLVIGTPIASADEGHQRLSKKIALPVFASDAISSTAYATDEILIVLLGAGAGYAAFTKLVPIAIVVAVLLVIVITSYRQTIFAYPSGGGSYIVSKENLGVIPALIAGSSLLVDYILTVAVSVAGGVLAIRSAFGFDNKWTVPICLGCILLMTLANLRGLKESGALFAPPTYIYVVSLITLIVVGLVRRTSAPSIRTRSARKLPSSPRVSRASASSCCCEPSAPVPLRCPVSRRCPMACPRSRSRRARTPHRPSCGWAPSWVAASSASRFWLLT
jgi:Amino acid permease